MMKIPSDQNGKANHPLYYFPYPQPIITYAIQLIVLEYYICSYQPSINNIIFNDPSGPNFYSPKNHDIDMQVGLMVIPNQIRK